jgi:hypothetical protein
LGVPKPNTRRWAYLVPEGLSADNFMNLEGDVDNVDNNAPTVIAATTSAPTMLDYATATSTNNYDNLYGQPNYNSSANPDFQAYLKLTATTNIRIWSGLTSDGGGTMEGSANPAGNYAAFRYDTSASDTDYECITKDGTTQTITSSGIAPGTTGHKLEVILTLGSTNAQFLIDGAIVCNNTTHLPAASTMMRYDNEVTTLTAAAAHMQLGWVYVESNQ